MKQSLVMLMVVLLGLAGSGCDKPERRSWLAESDEVQVLVKTDMGFESKLKTSHPEVIKYFSRVGHTVKGTDTISNPLIKIELNRNGYLYAQGEIVENSNKKSAILKWIKNGHIKYVNLDKSEWKFIKNLLE